MKIMKRNFLFIFILFVTFTIVKAQEADVNTMKTQLAEKKAAFGAKQGEVAKLQGEIDALQKKIDKAAGWRFNAGGVIGFSMANFQNWIKQANPDSRVSNITGLFKGNALLDKPKYFWRNEGNINLGWQQLVLNSESATKEEKEYKNVADIFTLTSLFGYKITPDIAVSALGQYNTSLVNKFNNPGILDIGAGATWTPHQLSNFVLTVHPLNYHIVFQKGDIETQKALGMKLFASYFTNIYKGIKWSTDINGFLEYGKSDTSLNEYTWNNSISLPAWHGIGIGIGFGFRKSAVESKDLQSYYNLGLSYNL